MWSVFRKTSEVNFILSLDLPAKVMDQFLTSKVEKVGEPQQKESLNHCLPLKLSQAEYFPVFIGKSVGFFYQFLLVNLLQFKGTKNNQFNNNDKKQIVANYSITRVKVAIGAL